MNEDEELILHRNKIAFGKFEDGRKKMIVRFTHGASWVPRWVEDMCEIYDKGLYFEEFNMKRYGKGKPKASQLGQSNHQDP
nr:hypothetical protein [Candidatus Njordarchaeota archaeon]